MLHLYRIVRVGLVCGMGVGGVRVLEGSCLEVVVVVVLVVEGGLWVKGWVARGVLVSVGLWVQHQLFRQ